MKIVNLGGGTPPIVIDERPGGHAYTMDGSVLTLHPKTGKLVRESSLRWPDDYPTSEIVEVLLMGGETRERARKRAAELGCWEAEKLLGGTGKPEEPAPAPEPAAPEVTVAAPEVPKRSAFMRAIDVLLGRRT